jgi:hypothetical protein
VDVVAAGDVGEGFAPVAAAKRRAALVRGELEGAAQALPARLGPLPAFAGVGTDQFAATGTARSSTVGRLTGSPGSNRPGRDERLFAEARDAIGMQLLIGDRPAFLLHTIGTEPAIGVHHRLITLAVAYVLPRRPRA